MADVLQTQAFSADPARVLGAFAAYVQRRRVGWVRRAIRGVGGTVVLHWADVEIAAAWLEWARRTVNNEALWAAMLAPHEGLYPAGQSPSDLVQAVVFAICEVCNALNVQWHTIPQLHAVYAEFFCGMPDGRFPFRGALSVTAENYANAWWRGTDSSAAPVVRGADTAPGGEVPGLPYPLPTMRGTLANRAWQLTQGYPLARLESVLFPLHFVPRVIAAGANPDVVQSELTAERLRNVPPPIDDRYAIWNELNQRNAPPSGGAVRLLNCYDTRSGALCKLGAGDWVGPGTPFDRPDAVRFSPRGILLPARDYLPWLRALVRALDDVTAQGTAMEAAILASRKWVAEANYAAASANGGLSAWVEALGVRDGDVYDEQHRLTPEVQIATAAITAVGAALGPFTLGIAPLIAGGLSAFTRLADAAILKDVHNRGRDDQGRFKPVFERGWLSGDPSEENPRTGQPDFDLSTPPGWGTGATVATANLNATDALVQAVQKTVAGFVPGTGLAQPPASIPASLGSLPLILGFPVTVQQPGGLGDPNLVVGVPNTLQRPTKTVGNTPLRPNANGAAAGTKAGARGPRRTDGGGDTIDDGALNGGGGTGSDPRDAFQAVTGGGTSGGAPPPVATGYGTGAAFAAAGAGLLFGWLFSNRNG